MRLTKPAVATLSAAALVTLAACGGGGGGGGGGTPNSPQASQNLGQSGAGGKSKDPTLVNGPAKPVPGATKGGTMTISTAVAPSTFDPTRVYYVDSAAIMEDLVTRSLTTFQWRPSPGGGQGEMVLVPDMATNLGTHNANNTKWSFTLKKGLKYEDGTPVTAKDIAYAVKRSFAIAELPDGPTYQTTFFKDGDTYKGPYKDGDQYSGVKVHGRTVTILMRRPFPDMDYYASFPLFTGIPEAKDNPQTYGNHPLATGPYKFQSYKPGQQLVLVKNTQWDPKTDPIRHQYVDKWVFNFGVDQTKEDQTIINDTGVGQTTATYDNVLAPDYKTLIDQGDQDRLVLGTQPCTFMWFLDMTKIKDINVRRAIGYAFPYRDYWKAGGEIVGVTRVPGTSILPPGTAGRVKYDPLGIGGVNTDTAKAHALLKKSGNLGYKLKWYYVSDDKAAVQAKNEEVKGLKAAGFDPEPVASTSEKIRDDQARYNAPVNIRSSGWCSDWPTGGSWFPAQWAGSLVGVPGMPNPANFKEPAFDKKLNHILDTDTPAEAAQDWGKLDKFMETKYYPAVNLGYGGVAMIHGSRVGGMHNDNVLGMPTFADMYVKK